MATARLDSYGLTLLVLKLLSQLKISWLFDCIYRSLKSQLIKGQYGEVFKHPDIAVLSLDEVCMNTQYTQLSQKGLKVAKADQIADCSRVALATEKHTFINSFEEAIQMTEFTKIFSLLFMTPNYTYNVLPIAATVTIVYRRYLME